MASAVVALVIGGAAGYYARGSEVSALEANIAKAVESKKMLEEEVKAVQADATKAKEGKAMLEAELNAKTVPVRLNAEKGQMAHDVWLLVAPVAQGKYAVALRAEGLESKGAYIVDGVTRTEPMQTLPIAGKIPESEFIADENGNGLYWLLLDKDPRVAFEKIIILYLPNMQMDKAVVTATAILS